MFGLFSRKKAYRAQINSGAAEVEIAAGDNLLNAALNSGLKWPHNCRVGSCGTCRCRLLDGKIKPLNDFSYVLDGDELDAGMILACQTRACSDIEVAVELESAAAVESVDGVIEQSKVLTHDILQIEIALDRSLPPYLAGQYAEINIGSLDAPRSYSFARAQTREDPARATFFVRLVPGGEMSGWLHAQSRIGAKVVVSGPFGSFYLRDSKVPIVCIAGGSGLAPIKALLEQFCDDGFNRPVKFLFGARGQRDLYCLDDIASIQQIGGDLFEFVPILSEEDAASNWDGLRGLVTEHLECVDFTLADSEAYLCGPPPMIDSAIARLTAAGMSPSQIYFDKFLDASHLPEGRRLLGMAG